MKKVILDTNVLMLFPRFDVIEEIKKAMDCQVQFVFINPVLEELQKLSIGTNKFSRAAKLALNIIKEQPVMQIEGYADDVLVLLSKEGCIIATSDKLLKKRLSGRVLVPRQNKYFVLV